LLAAMERAARDEGWTLTRDPSAAKFRLRATSRFFGEVRPETGGAHVARGFGLIGGAAVGAAAGGAVSTFSGGRSAGVATGIGVGLVSAGVMQVGIANGSAPREWALILDIVLEEYADEPVEFDLAADQDNAGSEIENTSYGVMHRTSHYYPHGMRLSVWANQMNMQEEEALPHILTRAEKVLGEMLPK